MGITVTGYYLLRDGGLERGQLNFLIGSKNTLLVNGVVRVGKTMGRKQTSVSDLALPGYSECGSKNRVKEKHTCVFIPYN